MTTSPRPAWKTNMRSGRAHLVMNQRPICDAPIPPEGVTWYPRRAARVLCDDCQNLDSTK